MLPNVVQVMHVLIFSNLKKCFNFTLLLFALYFRHFHAAVCAQVAPALHAIYIYGGLDSLGRAIKEMWKFNLSSLRWSNLSIEDPDTDWPIPAMAGHTMSLVDDVYIWLVGGFSTENYFTEHIFKYDTTTNEWSQPEATGSPPTGRLRKKEKSSLIYLNITFDSTF